MKNILAVALLGSFAVSFVLAQAPAPAARKAEADATALAQAALVRNRLANTPGSDKTLRSLTAAVLALPPWAPFYPGALLGMDSGKDGPGVVQVGFTTTDSEAQVARFYMQRLQARGKPVDLKEGPMRTIEVSNAQGNQITTILLSPGSGGGTSGVIKHEGGGY
jgi:hypothetical protein